MQGTGIEFECLSLPSASRILYPLHMTARSFVFGVDLDGVVADFYGGLRPIAAEWLGVDLDSLPQRVSWGLAEWGVDEAPGGYERLHRFAVTQRELFLRMPPMPGAPQTLRRL